MELNRRDLLAAGVSMGIWMGMAGARLTGGNSEAITRLGREFTKRKMPV